MTHSAFSSLLRYKFHLSLEARTLIQTLIQIFSINVVLLRPTGTTQHEVFSSN